MFIDISILQPMPASNPNRDDTGSPKSATYGGVRRHRVSSQSWKRAVRKEFARQIPAKYLGLRTQRAVEMVSKVVAEKDPSLADSAVKLAEKIFTTAGIKLDAAVEGEGAQMKYLYFISRQQVEAIADAIVSAETSGVKLSKKDVKALLKEKNSIDLALFGRMVADDADFNVDASCQVAHALSTHGAETEFDYFTGVDDVKDAAEDDRSSGAGMIGTVEFVSSCLYRFATVNVDQLVNNLGSKEDAEVAVSAFLKAFVRSVPGGKINTFANHSLPSAVYVALRQDQPISLVGAFEEPIRAGLEGGYVQRSAEKLHAYATSMYRVYGGPVQSWTCVGDSAAEAVRDLGPDVDIDTLANEVVQAVFAEGE